MVQAEVVLADVGRGGNGMDLKNRSMDSVSTFVSQGSSPGVGAMSEDLSSMKSDDLLSVKVKLMCSYGGRIMPRPHDNQLRYVGGETRILVVSRNISFVDLLSKLTRLCGKAVSVKYQLPNEDLDVLVSVTCDEDLDNMMEEYDGMESRDSSCRLRVFMFPMKEQNLAEALEESRNVEQRFLDAVNGMAFTSKRQSSSSTATTTHMPDFLFGLDSLANPDLNPVVPHLVTSDSHSTYQNLDSSLPGGQTHLGVDPLLAPSPLDDSPKDATDKSVISLLESTSPTKSVLQIESSSGMADLKQPTPSYVPLVEVSRDQLPKGMVLRQYSVESSCLGSVDLPKDASKFAKVSGNLDPQVQASASPDVKDPNPSFAIADIESNLSKLPQDYAEICRNLNISASSEKNILDNHKPDDGEDYVLNASHLQSALDSVEKRESALQLDEGSTQHNIIDLIGQNQILKDGEFEFHKKFEDSERVDLQKSSTWLAPSEQLQPELHMNVESHQSGQVFKYLEGNGKERIIPMQRRASDPVPLPHSHEPNLEPQLVPNNRFHPTTSGLVEDKPQRSYERVESLPQIGGFVPKPRSTHNPVETITRVASAPYTMRNANDLVPNYAPPVYPVANRPFTPNLPYSGLQPPLPMRSLKVYVPSVDRAVSHSPQTAQASSKFSESGVEEHVKLMADQLPRPLQTFKDQFAYNVDPPVDPGVPLHYHAHTPHVNYVPHYKITNAFEDGRTPTPFPDAGFLEAMEAQSAPGEGRNSVLQPVIRNE